MRSEETKGVLDEVAAKSAGELAELEGLRAKRPALISACVGDAARRPELDALDTQIRTLEVDHEITTAAGLEAAGKHQAAVRVETRAAIALRLEAGGYQAALVKQYESYVRKMVDLEREVWLEHVRMVRACETQRLLVDEAKALGETIGERVTEPTLDVDYLRVAASVAIANTRTLESRQEALVAAFITPIAAPEYWDGGVKRQHPLCTGPQFEFATRYVTIREGERTGT